jgi:hypothetical protein
LQLIGTGGGERDSAGALVGRIGRDLREPQVLKLPDLPGDLGGMDILRGGNLRRADSRGHGDDLQKTEGACALLLASGPIQRRVRHEQRGHHRAYVVPARLHAAHAILVDRRNHHCAELEPVMNPIEKVMADRSSHVKLALAVVALVLVLWATGSPLPSLWITPVIIVLLWIAIQLGLGPEPDRSRWQRY